MALVGDERRARSAAVAPLFESRVGWTRHVTHAGGSRAAVRRRTRRPCGPSLAREPAAHRAAA
ncbi:hypothetical protein AQ903_10725 [Burkholderia pseudomallei]|nr:hypothetical protein AQ903_10725 [Burkholderia pseudomallei]